MKKSSNSALTLISHPRSHMTTIVSYFKYTLMLCFSVLLLVNEYYVVQHLTVLVLNSSSCSCFLKSRDRGTTGLMSYWSNLKISKESVMNEVALPLMVCFRTKHASCLNVSFCSHSEIWSSRETTSDSGHLRPTFLIHYLSLDLFTSDSSPNRQSLAFCQAVTVMGNIQCVYVRFRFFPPILLSFLHRNLLWKGKRV